MMRRMFLFYPLLVAAFPLIFLASRNPYEVTFSQVAGVLIIVWGVTFLLAVALRTFIRDNARVAAIVSILLIAFFSYGHLVDGVSAVLGYGVPFLGIAGSRYLVFFVSILGFGGVSVSIWAILRYKGSIDSPIRYFGVAMLILLVFNTGALFLSTVQADRDPDAKNKQTVVAAERPSPVNSVYQEGELPDIYYIILDGYTRADVLEQVYGFDNSAFLDSLRQRGFYIAEQSRSNYIQTKYSLPSSLNMRYLDRNETKSKQMSQLFVNNKVMRLAKDMGYTIVHFDSGWRFTADNPSADLVIRPPAGFWGEALLSDYGRSLLESTAARFVDGKIIRYFSAKSVERFHYTADILGGEIPAISEPTFSFVHFGPPHPPYIFDRTGRVLSKTKDNPQTKDDWHLKELYVDEVIYLNSVIEGIVDEILAQSEIEPVIILQGDHGTASSRDRRLGEMNTIVNDEFIFERTGIMNAYYLPEHCRPGLYQSISPVNSFRLVFDNCLGTDLGLLEDKSYAYRTSPVIGYYELDEVSLTGPN